MDYKNHNKQGGIEIIFLAVVLFVVLGAGIYFVIRFNSSESNTPKSSKLVVTEYVERPSVVIEDVNLNNVHEEDEDHNHNNVNHQSHLFGDVKTEMMDGLPPYADPALKSSATSR